MHARLVDACHMLQAGQVRCGDIEKSDTVTSSLTAEQRATIEQNRAKALDAYLCLPPTNGRYEF